MNSILKKALIPIFKSVAKLPLGLPHHNREIELMNNGKKPTCILSLSDEEMGLEEKPEKYKEKYQLLKENIADGKIVLIGSSQINGKTIDVLCQADKIKEGKELYSRGYKNSEGYIKLESKKYHRRIGELLGYDQNDLDRYDAGTIKDCILKKTSVLRRKIRKELENIPN